MSILPQKNRLGFYEIRLESIGGLGANLAGKMLAEAGVTGSGLNGSNFSSYGSEKKGSPVKAFVRFCDAEVEIRDHSPIEQPHVIGVFHEALYKTVDVCAGLLPGGTVLVNSAREAEQVARDIKLNRGTLAVVDALNIAVEEKTKVNTAMLGALFRICGFLDPDNMREVIRRTFQKKLPHLVESNIRTFNRGYEEVRFLTLQSNAEETQDGYIRQEPLLGYSTQEPGGILTVTANSVMKDLSGSRQGFIPKFNKEDCINCAACDTVCPDFCFVWERRPDKRGNLQMFMEGIDYQYCKGCLKCVEACPTSALSEMLEVQHYAEQHRVPQKFPYLTMGGVH